MFATNPKILITFTNRFSLKIAKDLAKKLNLPLISSDSIGTIKKEIDLIINVTQTRLEIHENTPNLKFNHPIIIDFLSRRNQIRKKQASHKKELLAKALCIKIGGKDKEKITVLDLTAGFGTDAYLLANLGAKVTMIERSLIVVELLKDALKRASNEITEKKLLINLVQEDSLIYLKKLAKDNYPDVSYLDPMYPERKKSALGKKELRVLKKIVGGNDNAEELLNQALTIAKKRTVVKRPRLAPWLANLKPDFSLSGKTTRFDVYISC